MTPANLTAWRHAHQLSKAGLARLMQKSRRTVVAWESNEYPIPHSVEMHLIALDGCYTIDEMKAYAAPNRENADD